MGSEERSGGLPVQREYYWSIQEETLLLELRKTDKTWQDISESLGRTGSACSHHHAICLGALKTFHNSEQLEKKMSWKAEDDRLLISLVEGEAGGTWREILCSFPRRTESGCMSHYYIDLRKLIEPEEISESLPVNPKKYWNVKNETLLLELKKAGKKWQDVSDSLERTVGACMSHHKKCHVAFKTFHDRQQIEKKMTWRAEDDGLLTVLIEAGSTWRDILCYFPGRTESDCMGHYYVDLRKFAPSGISDAEVQQNRHQGRAQIQQPPRHTTDPLSQAESVPRGPVTLPSFSELAASVGSLSQSPPRNT
ncbi:hypothetical protein E4U59_002297 [Claviceps monticola]|nr:hypothetical protein E4U59_002297 [Claviceps monticola]